jgi:hypothetical protein
MVDVSIAFICDLACDTPAQVKTWYSSEQVVAGNRRKERMQWLKTANTTP